MSLECSSAEDGFGISTGWSLLEMQSPVSARTSKREVEEAFRCSNTSFCSSLGSVSARGHQNLKTAKLLRKAVDNQFKATPQSTKLQEWKGSGVEEKLKKRVDTQQYLIQLISNRIEGTEIIIRRVNQALFQLHRDQDSFYPIRQFVERRLEIRDQLPPEEKVEDEFQRALKQEQYLVSKGIADIGDYVMAGGDLYAALEAAKAALVDDVQFKRHALRLERSALQFDPYHGRDRACVLPRVPTANGTETTSTSEEKTENVRRSAAAAKELIARTRVLEESAARFSIESAEVVQRTKQEVRDAGVQTNASMRKSMAERLAMKKRFEKEVSESQGDINRTTQLLQNTRLEVESQQASLAQWKDSPDIPLSMFDQRLPRSVQEDMRETAIGRMQEQADLAKSNVRILQVRADETEALLEQLKGSHQELVVHLDLKTAATNTDMNCSKVMLNSSKAQIVDGASMASFVRTSVVMSKDISRQLPPPKPLGEKTIDQLRAKIKAASYTGSNGRQLELIFGRFDKDGTGCLDPVEIRMAIRRTLRIPRDVISDSQISSLCALLDADNSGSVSLSELVAWVGIDRLKEGAVKDSFFSGLGIQKVGGAAFELDCLATARSRLPASGSTPRGSMSPRKKGPPLSATVIETLRMRVKAAAYAGHMGREIQALFGRFDRDGSGKLEADEVRQALRRALRIPKNVVSDEEIMSFCDMLDLDGSGDISIAEIVEFVGRDPETSKRTGRQLVRTITATAEAGATSETWMAGADEEHFPGKPETG